jgi:aspartate racemase
MKTIGLIGGMSWESSAVYYQLINKRANELMGGFTSCKSLMYTVDFSEIERLQHEGNWKMLDHMMAEAATSLYKGGAEVIALCTNTMHLCSEAIKEAVPIPFLHIAEATGEAIISKAIRKVGLLGTKFTMEKQFYSDILRQQFGIETIVPDKTDRDEVHRIIYEELVHGIIKVESRTMYVDVIKKLEESGAEGVILGCTEIPLLISDKDVDIPTFDTTKIHAEKAVEWAME